MSSVLPSPTQLRGQTVPQFTTCPHCSILRNGECFVCQAGDENHPSCQNCKGGLYSPPSSPWYQDEMVISIATAVVVSVFSALIIASIQGAMNKKD